MLPVVAMLVWWQMLMKVLTAFHQMSNACNTYLSGAPGLSELTYESGSDPLNSDQGISPSLNAAKNQLMGSS